MAGVGAKMVPVVQPKYRGLECTDKSGEQRCWGRWIEAVGRRMSRRSGSLDGGGDNRLVESGIPCLEEVRILKVTNVCARKPIHLVSRNLKTRS